MTPATKVTLQFCAEAQIHLSAATESIAATEGAPLTAELVERLLELALQATFTAGLLASGLKVDWSPDARPSALLAAKIDRARQIIADAHVELHCEYDLEPAGDA